MKCHGCGICSLTYANVLVDEPSALEDRSQKPGARSKKPVHARRFRLTLKFLQTSRQINKKEKKVAVIIFSAPRPNAKGLRPTYLNRIEKILPKPNA
jgi:hypothetical protein